MDILSDLNKIQVTFLAILLISHQNFLIHSPRCIISKRVQYEVEIVIKSQ